MVDTIYIYPHRASKQSKEKAIFGQDKQKKAEKEPSEYDEAEERQKYNDVLKNDTDRPMEDKQFKNYINDK